MFARVFVFVAVVGVVGSCGPEAAVVPRSGVYDVTIETLENDCDPPPAEPRAPSFDMFPDAVRFAEDGLTIGVQDRLTLAACEGCAPQLSWMYPRLALDAETGRYSQPLSEPSERDGCLNVTPTVVAEVLDEGTVRARVTEQWVDAGGCAGLSGERCTTVHEYTYGLLEACDDCTLDELQERARALLAEQHPPPK